MLDSKSFNRWLDEHHLSACELALPYADENVRVLEIQSAGLSFAAFA